MPIRLDRFLTLYFFYPLVKLLPRRKGLRIPILMYHSISDEPETGHPYYWINTSPARFEEHMCFLSENGYTVISLSHAVELLFGPRETTEGSQESGVRSQEGLVKDAVARSPEFSTNHTNSTNQTNPAVSAVQLIKPIQPIKPVVLTFDDGYRDFYTHAFPVLKKYGFTATVFLPTAYIDNNGKPGLKGKQHLTWDEVRELHAQGISFGSHTVSHPQLRKLSDQEIEVEVTRSKKAIEGNTPGTCSQFCYPFKYPEENKEFTRRLCNILGSSGYTCGVSTKIGLATKKDEVFSIRRLPVNTVDDTRFLATKLAGAYNWISLPQRGLKAIKGYDSKRQVSGKQAFCQRQASAT